MKMPNLFKRKPPAWKCPCGNVIVKKGAKLSGCDWDDHGIHVHCPKCNVTVEGFIDPKKVEIYAEGIRYVG